VLINEYSNFVRLSDETGSKSWSDRQRIAQYGIASEIGSLVAAIKKKDLLEPSRPWDTYNAEIVEELGDIVWYTVMLAALHENTALDIVRCDLASLPVEIENDKKFKDALDPQKYARFLRGSQDFLSDERPRSFDDYQNISVLTSRTSGQDLLHVCLTRLLLYATVMMSHGFPQVEKYMQTDIVRLDLLRSLGMVMWHVAALANVLGLSFDELVCKNRNKLNGLSNFDRAPPTPLHDEAIEIPDDERLPRQFEVSFISTAEGRLQMFYQGKPLGNELTDNSRENDGYRFHDCMHLANAATLGWSPVLRSLMGRKRKYDKYIDVIEDGARAQIVEEAVVKAVHAEGERASGIGASDPNYMPTDLFTSKEQISFSFLKLIRRFVRNLEVERNNFWEWQQAIVQGHKIYAALRKEGQGTVYVDIRERTIKFDKRVMPNVLGPVVSVASVTSSLSLGGDHGEIVARARKAGILQALGFKDYDDSYLDKIQVVPFGEGISVKAADDVQERIWSQNIIEFRKIETEVCGVLVCNVLALSC
jgi:NTP pyrophosphatase (non-canonical NTP hydrolase)